MPQYRLNYFNIKGRAEFLRLIFALGGQEYVDHRFSMEQWPEEKTDTRRYPFGVGPTLEIDDVVLPESIPIARYLASEFGLCGKNNLEKAWCDIVVDIIMEIAKLAKEFAPFYRTEKDDEKFEQKKKEVFEGDIAKKLNQLEGILKRNNDGSGFFVGDEATWADLALANFSVHFVGLYPTCLDKTLLLKALIDRVNELPRIKKWIETRPDTPY